MAFGRGPIQSRSRWRIILFRWLDVLLLGVVVALLWQGIFFISAHYDWIDWTAIHHALSHLHLYAWSLSALAVLFLVIWLLGAWGAYGFISMHRGQQLKFRDWQVQQLCYPSVTISIGLCCVLLVLYEIYMLPLGVEGYYFPNPALYLTHVSEVQQHRAFRLYLNFIYPLLIVFMFWLPFTLVSVLVVLRRMYRFFWGAYYVELNDSTVEHGRRHYRGLLRGLWVCVAMCIFGLGIVGVFYFLSFLVEWWIYLSRQKNHEDVEQDTQASTLNTRPKTYEGFREWANTEGPVNNAKRDLFQFDLQVHQLSESIRSYLHRINDDREFTSGGLVLNGRFGAGKSSLTQMGIQKAEAHFLQYQTKPLVVTLNVMGIDYSKDGSSALFKYILNQLQVELNHHVDVVSINQMARSYVQDATGSMPWWMQILIVLGLEVDKRYYLQMINQRLIAINTVMILVLEDLDRRDEWNDTFWQMADLLDLFKDQSHIYTLLPIDTRRLGVDTETR